MKHPATRSILALFVFVLASCVSVDSDRDRPTTQASSLGSARSGLLNDQEIQSLLAAHNEARAEVGVPPLEYSSSLAAYAQEWADFLASSGCQLQHRNAAAYGENLAVFSGGAARPADAAWLWYGEKSAYDGGPVTLASLVRIGHYTQMVWRGTTAVGCGRAVCPDGSVIYVCNYNPPGNQPGAMPF